MANDEDSNLIGTKGWLVLVVLAWVFTPVQTALILYDLYANVFANGGWQVLTTPGSELYSSLWLPAVTLGVAGNLVLSALGIFALCLLLKRSRHTQAVAISWFSLNLLLVAADYEIASRLPGFADEPFGEFDAIKELVRAGLMAVVWIPYFVFSKRVRSTCTSDWPKRSFDTVPRVGT